MLQSTTPANAPATATRSLRRRLAVVTAVVAAALVGTVVSTLPAEATSQPVNPLAGRPWGVDTRHELWRAYEESTGDSKELLGSMAHKPNVFWYADIVPDWDIERRVRDHIATAQAGNPEAIVQLAMFRLWPEGEAARDKPLTAADQQSYRTWVDGAARGIGSSRVAMVLEPDLAVALKGWRPEVRLKLARYAAKRFSSLPNTTIYLDAGSSDWLSVSAAVKMLRAAGIQYVHGFSLGATHYADTASEVAYGSALVSALRKAGFPGRRFVVDTADSGRPFTYQQYYAKHPNGFFDNAEACRTRQERRCVTLGIPPTTAVGSEQWGLPAAQRRQARANVDAYLWFSRPWYTYGRPVGIVRPDGPFDLQRALQVARTSRY